MLIDKEDTQLINLTNEAAEELTKFTLNKYITVILSYNYLYFWFNTHSFIHAGMRIG